MELDRKQNQLPLLSSPLLVNSVWKQLTQRCQGEETAEGKKLNQETSSTTLLVQGCRNQEGEKRFHRI